MIGKTINIPENLHNGISKIKKEKEVSFQSAKVLLQEVAELRTALLDIIDESMPELSGYDYLVDIKQMHVIVIKKKD